MTINRHEQYNHGRLLALTKSLIRGRFFVSTNPLHKPATRRDVARLAGVSETIVSYVLNNNRYVAKDKRERVLQAVKELQYRPNNIARALRGKRSGHILFIADNIADEHFGRIIREMEQLAYDRGSLISLTASHNAPDFVSQIISRQVDGIVVSSLSLEKRYMLELLESGVPVVLLMNREYPDEITSRAGCIYTGIQQGMENAVQLLYRRGRRSIVYVDRVSRRGHFSGWEDMRYKGFCDEMRRCGLEVKKESILAGYRDEEALFEGLCSRLRSGPPIDGLVGRNDNLACLALSALQQCGRRVPEDVSVIGFNNSRIAACTQPGLTSVEIDRQEVARSILAMLDRMFSGQAPGVVRIDTRIVSRGSV